MNNRAEQKARILQLSRELFTTYGFERTTLRQISQTANIAELKLHYLFPQGKQQILNDVVTIGFRKRLQVLQSSDSGLVITRLNDALKSIDDIFNSLWQVFSDQENYQSFMILVHERILLSDVQVRELIELNGMVETRINRVLQASKPLLTISEANISLVAGMIAALFQKSVFDELLVRHHREVAQSERQKVLIQVRLILLQNGVK